MLDAKDNYRGKYNNLDCRLCRNETETQEHILENCQTIHSTNNTKVHKEEIFDDNPTNLSNTAAKIQTIIDKLHNTNQTQNMV